ncbi:MAG TPA: hypothetical protein VF491_11420, partial [Vicinamibacterales bacterium]
MTFPSFVTRAAVRIALGGVVAAAAIAVAALVIERTQLGGDLEASRARLRAEVEGEFAALAARLDQAVHAVTLDAETVRRAERGDAGALRQLFDQVSVSADGAGVSVTIYGAANQPVAWIGRTEDIPDVRLSGPASSFLAQSTQGLQLVRVQPVVDPAEPARHIGAVVAEAQLPRTAGEPLPGTEFSLETSIVPVAMRLQFEGASDAGPDAFVIRSATSEPLAAVIVADEDLRGARQRIRRQLAGAELALAALLLLLLAGPLLDWRRLTRSTAGATALTLAIAGLLLTARWVAWVAIRKTDLAGFPLLQPLPATRFSDLAFASPVDFLLNALVIAGLVGLLVSSFVRWRSAHRPGIGVIVVDGATTSLAFYAAQLLAGAAVAVIVVSYEWFLRTHVSATGVDIVRFALDRLDPIRLPVIVGLIALNAAVFGLAVLLYRLAWSPWTFRGHQLSWRLRAVGLWLVPSAIFFSAMTADELAPQWPSLIVVVAAAGAAWLIHRYGPVARHGSQALRLALSFLTLAIPSLVLYPSLVDASQRARRQLIEGEYAPEVINQRQDLHSKLEKALREIDRIVALEDLVRASDPPVSGSPSTDAAFLVWSQTSL